MDGSARGGAPRAILCLLVLVVSGATGIKNLRITVPERVRVGDSAILTCSYDLEDAQLYTIKWYLDEAEFYSYVPLKEPPHNTYESSHVQVNVSGSNTQDVTLVNVRRNNSGRYKCEVSEDAPRYDTDIQSAYLFVVDVPETDPRIAVEREHLQPGETLRANCTSGVSRPAPNVTWTLNGAALNNAAMKFNLRSRTTLPRADNKTSTFSSLELVVTAGLFRDGQIDLRCYAEITPVYKKSTLKRITEEGPYIASITGDASPHSRQSSGCGRLRPSSLWARASSLLALSSTLGLLLEAASAR